jgi:hypothetical protein
MLAVAGSFSIFLGLQLLLLIVARQPVGGKLWRYGLLAGRAANLHIFHHHFLPAHSQTSSSAVAQGLI